MNDNEDDICWICLETCSKHERSECGCKKMCVHKLCLAKWQLRQAGTTQEKVCRFCNEKLPDWRYVLRPDYCLYMDQVIVVKCVCMNREIGIPVTGGMEKSDFIKYLVSHVGGTYHEGDDTSIFKSVSFGCIIPDENQFINFKGIDSFDAMLFCARVCSKENINISNIEIHSHDGYQHEDIFPDFSESFTSCMNSLIFIISSIARTIC